jgi:hypothetical protein
MAETYTEKYYFGIHDNNMNLTSFTLTKETDGDNYTDFQIQGNSGLMIQEEDYSVVLEIAINLSGFGENSEFDSVKGDTYIICKLTEEEHSHFTEYAK